MPLFPSLYKPQNVLPLLRRCDTSQPNLAADVKAYLSSSTAAASMLTNKNKADRKSLVEMITNYQLMAGLVNLFEIDPMLAFSAPPQVHVHTLHVHTCSVWCPALVCVYVLCLVCW